MGGLMKIYFAGSIRGGREDVAIYNELIEELKKYGVVLTEHVGDYSLSIKGQTTYSDKYIHDRDVDWIKESDVLVADVTKASLGVGYEIAVAETLSIPILVLFGESNYENISAMILGSSGVVCKGYSDINEAKKLIKLFFSNIVL